MTYIPNLTGVTQGTNPTTEVIASNGNQALEVAIAEPRTAFNEVSIAEPYPLAQIDFVYGISTLVTTSNVHGSNATITASSGVARITSNATSGATAAILNSKKFVTFRPGQGVMIRIATAFSPPASGSVQLAGGGFAVANTTYLIDFLGFGYGNAAAPTQFSILWRRNGVDTWYPQSSWIYDPLDGTGKSGMDINPLLFNSFQIQYQYVGCLNFYVENPATGRFVIVHQIPSVNAASVPNFQNPTLQLVWYSNNASSSNTITCYAASGSNFLEGNREFTGPRNSFSYTPSANLALNTETMIFAIKNSTYFGLTQQNVIPNRSQAHLRGFSATAAGRAGAGTNPDPYFSPPPATVVFRQIRNPTGGPSLWTPLNGTNQSDSDGSNIYGSSMMSSNTSQITNLSGGASGFTVTVPVGGSVFFDFKMFESVAYPGDVLCFTANVNSVFQSSNVTVSVALTWNEDI